MPKDETEELISRYKEINNVLYPKDIKEIENLVKSAENEFKEIEKERWLNRGKDVIGASLSIGSAFIPAAAGARITTLLARTLAPKLGTKLAFEVSKNAVIGAMSGSVMGLGDSLINNENPITTMLRYALIGSLLGMGSGAVGYKLGKNTLLIASKYNKNLIENPIINGKFIEGTYSKIEIEKFKEIDKIFTKNGYNLSGHAIQRVYERSNTEEVLYILKNGEKYLDKYGHIVYYDKGITIHINPVTKRIITVVYRDRKLPKAWRKL